MIFPEGFGCKYEASNGRAGERKARADRAFVCSADLPTSWHAMDSEALALRLGNYEGGDAVARHYHGKSGAETINRGFGDALARFEGHLSPLVARSLGRVVVAVDSDGG